MPIPVRAKFFVTSATPPEGATAAQVTLSAVCRGVENAMWSQATPSGLIQMTVKNDPAYEQFIQHEEYEVTFRHVPKPKPGDGHKIKQAVNMHGGIVCETCGAQLGYTEEAVKNSPHLASYNTEEIRAEARKRHDETFGAKS